MKVFLEPDPPAGEPSCADWVRALPRRVILQPGQRQTVRLLAQPPAGLPDGEYWSRVVISSKSLPRDGDTVEVEGHEGVRVGLTLSTRTIISLNYRKGPVSTGLDVESLSASLDMTCELGDPLRSYDAPASIGRRAQWDVATGLALRETE